MTVEISDRWRLYTQTHPSNASPVGVVMDGANPGALFYLPATRRYVQINAGVITNLDQFAVRRAIENTFPKPKRTALTACTRCNENRPVEYAVSSTVDGKPYTQEVCSPCALQAREQMARQRSYNMGIGPIESVRRLEASDVNR